MLVFGHVGLTVAGVRAAAPERADLRGPVALALLPDLVDKPLAFLLPALTAGSTRNFAHSALGAVAVLAVLRAVRGAKGDSALLWACLAGHLLLDRMWLRDNPLVLFWPFLGPFPAPAAGGFFEARLVGWNVAGEALGLALLWRHRAAVRAGLLRRAA